MTAPIALAVDGGNSKTDLALLRTDGTLLAYVRGPASSPHHLGLEGSLDVLGQLFDEAVQRAELATDGRPPAAVARLMLAGVDFPSEEEQAREAAEERGWAERISVGNDSFAVLRAGSQRGWGVAVVCGAGINCVGVAPDGRHARFPALGMITGDWGGGYDVGMAALWAAARSEDGRGAKTSLEQAVPEHFGLETPGRLAEAIHHGLIEQRRVVELAPAVLAEAAHDAVAAEIVERLASEVVALVRVALTRLELTQESVDVLLGGGLLRAGDGRLITLIEEGLHAVGSSISVRATASPAIVGAALLALDDLGAGADAQQRLRESLGAAVERSEGQEAVRG